MNVVVLVAYYNGEKYFKEQIDSILNQTIKPDKVVVCNDNPNDKNWDEVLEKFKDPRIEFIENDKNYGVNKTFKEMIDKYSPHYDATFLSDQDDIWMLNKIERQLEILKNYDICTHYSRLFHSNNNEYIFNDTEIKKKGEVDSLFSKLPGRTMAFTREFAISLKNVNFKPKENGRGMFYDNYIAMHACKMESKQYIIPEMLDNHRLHDSNISKDIGSTHITYYDYYLSYKMRIKIFKEEFGIKGVVKCTKLLTYNKSKLFIFVFAVLYYLPFLAPIFKLFKQKNPFYVGGK